MVATTWNKMQPSWIIHLAVHVHIVLSIPPWCLYLTLYLVGMVGVVNTTCRGIVYNGALRMWLEHTQWLASLWCCGWPWCMFGHSICSKMCVLPLQPIFTFIHIDYKRGTNNIRDPDIWWYFVLKSSTCTICERLPEPNKTKSGNERGNIRVQWLPFADTGFQAWVQVHHRKGVVKWVYMASTYGCSKS